MSIQQPSIADSIGCGSLGCAGGLLLGLFGGGLLLILLSVGWAATSTIPPLPSTANPKPDLRLILHESFLNQAVQNAMGDTARLSLMPDNRLSVTAQADVPAPGLAVPVQVTGLFELQLNGQALALQLLDVQVSGLTIPIELNLFDDELAAINRDLNLALKELSNTLGAPVILTGLSTDEANISIEAREAP